MSEERRIEFEIEVSGELRAAAYCNVASLAHAFELTLDFARAERAHVADDDDASAIRCRVVRGSGSRR